MGEIELPMVGLHRDYSRRVVNLMIDLLLQIAGRHRSLVGILRIVLEVDADGADDVTELIGEKEIAAVADGHFQRIVHVAGNHHPFRHIH